MQQVYNNLEEVDRHTAVTKNTYINNTHTLRQQLPAIYTLGPLTKINAEN
jgi:hypothetical protein